MHEMIKTGKGAIYNIEGYGNNDVHMLDLSINDTSKGPLIILRKG